MYGFTGLYIMAYIQEHLVGWEHDIITLLIQFRHREITCN